jgi:hypothetical protein
VSANAFVGPEQLGVGCGYSAALDSDQCEAEAVVHLLVDSPWGIVGLTSCGPHEPIARASARMVLGGHAWSPACDDAICWSQDHVGSDR